MSEGHETHGRRPNRLVHETSPYLLQHAYNPVAWYPWGPEALERAKAEDKPIFLSIGYSACHWCHVMERESFENEAIAAFLNEHFVSIKVDREERPDLDDIYMAAVQLMTGGGGWPMSVFLTPDRKPFYGGTYFPPEDRFGRAGFMTLLTGIEQAWREKRDEVLRSAESLTGAVQQQLVPMHAPAGELSTDLYDAALADLRGSFDEQEGGFSSAPKFPPPSAIAFLLRHYARTGDAGALEMATLTLDKMARGGMYDHLGGGFHRYSVDARWLVPHFEKMLYDNAQLSQVYLDAYQLTGNALYKRVAVETLDYVLRDMSDAAGGFHSSEDADSEGEEGTFYLWSVDEIRSELGEDDARVFCAYYDVKEEGNFDSPEPYHARRNVLHVPRPAAAVAEELGIEAAEFETRLGALRAKLRSLRSRRVRPGLDDKVLTSWNALMIAALARGYQVLGDERYRDAAVNAADFILTRMMRDGELLRTYRQGESRLPGFLDDYAFAVVALVELYEATFDVRWIEAADDVARRMIARLWDEEDGAFYFAPPAQGDLIARQKPTYDGAEPSGNAMAAIGLLRLAKLTDHPGYEEKAVRILEGNGSSMARAPRGFFAMLRAAEYVLSPVKEVAIVGPRGREDTEALLRALHSRFVPNRIVAALDPAADGAAAAVEKVPLLKGKQLLKGKRLVSGKAAAYVCKDYVCTAPVTEPEDLMAALGVWAKPAAPSGGVH